MRQRWIFKAVCLFVLCASGGWADCGNQGSSLVHLAVTIPADVNIHSVWVSFSFAGTSQAPIFSINTAEEDASQYNSDYDGNTVLDSYAVSTPTAGSESAVVDTNLDGGVDDGYQVSIARDATGNRYTLKLVAKRPGSGCTRGLVTGSSHTNTLHIRSLTGTYRITCVTAESYNNCNDPFAPSTSPTWVFSPCNQIAAVHIQDTTGTGTAHPANTVGQRRTTTDTGDEITLYANAYDSANNYLGPVDVSWSATGSFDSGDLSGATGSSVVFDPNNPGTGTVSASYCSAALTINPTGTITVAGALSYIVIVDTDTNPNPTTNAIGTISMTVSATRTLYAAGFDSSNTFRKLESSNWSLDDATYGSFSPTPGGSTTFTASCKAGTCTITANGPSSTTDSTGTVTISHGTIASIAITDSGGAVYTASPHAALGGTFTLYARGLDSCATSNSWPETVNWQITGYYFPGMGSGGGLSAPSGTSTTFTPPSSTVAGWVDIQASYSGLTPVTIRVVVDPGPLTHVKILDSDTATGSVVDDYILELTGSPTQSMMLYSIGFDAYENFRGPEPTSWGKTGTAAHGLSAGTPAPSATFTPNGAIGSSEVTITHATAGSSSGTITVIALQAADTFDVVHVLDHSGSMGSAAYPGASSPKKMDVVKAAADYFVRLMRENRQNRYGLVIFDHLIDTLTPIALLDTTAKNTVLNTTIPGIQHRGTTSIGGGLIRGLAQLQTVSGHSESILLLTDGMQNTPPDLPQFLSQYTAGGATFPVHIVAVGYSWGVDETRLQNLLDDLDGTHDGVYSRGTYRRIEDAATLQLSIFKAFHDIYLQNTQATMVTDPVLEIRKGDPEVHIPVQLTSDQTSAAFSVFWQGAANGLDLKLISPSGKTITRYTNNNRIRYGEHPNYKFFNALFPLSGDLNPERKGKWELVISVASFVPADAVIKFTSAVSAMGGTRMTAGFNKGSNRTGEPIKVSATLTRDGAPLTGVTVEAECSIPTTTVANALYDSNAPIPDSPTTTSTTVSGEPADTDAQIAARVDSVEEEAGTTLVQRTTEKLTLYDDGQHDDGQAADGVYGATFTNTRIAGVYDFRFIASAIPTEAGNTTTREWTASFYNQVNTDPASSSINVSILKITKDGNSYSLKFVPKDKYGNHLGPGFPMRLEVFTRNPGTIVAKDMKDNINGKYTAEFFVSTANLEHGPQIKISIDGKEFTQKPLPTHYQGILSFHGGVALPLDTLAASYAMGYCGTLDFGFSITPDFSAVGLIDLDYLPAKAAGANALYVLDGCIDARYRLRIIPPNIALYGMAGVGAYLMDFSAFEFGVNAGAGLEYKFSESLSLDLGARVHYLFNRAQVFMQTEAGLVWRFQLLY